jgi:hypothetical protein
MPVRLDRRTEGLAVDPIPLSGGRSSAASVVIGIVVLAALTAVYGAWPVWRAMFPFEIDVNEAWNAYHADAARSGGVLYPNADSLTANNYPPLSFYLIGAVSALGGDAILVGRLLSLLAVPIASGALASCVLALGGTRISATVAALWYVATMYRCFDVYVGMNDPQLPATAGMVCALAWLLHRFARGRTPDPAILLMGLAGFYKHTLVATPIAGLLYVATMSRSVALRAAIVGAAFVAAGLAFCVAVHGRAFLDQLLAPRVHSLVQALGSVGQLQWVAPALIVWAVWAWHDRGSPAARFTGLYIAAATVAFFLQKLGAGVAANAQFELVAATAIGLGLAFSRTASTALARRWGADASRLLILAILVARLLLSNHLEPYFVLASPDYRRLFHDNAEVVGREVARVRAIPGAVHCAVMTVCRQAGKPFVFDPFAIEQRIKTGKLTSEQVAAAIALRGIRFEPVDARATTEWADRRVFSNVR